MKKYMLQNISSVVQLLSTFYLLFQVFIYKSKGASDVGGYSIIENGHGDPNPGQGC